MQRGERADDLQPEDRAAACSRSGSGEFWLELAAALIGFVALLLVVGVSAQVAGLRLTRAQPIVALAVATMLPLAVSRAAHRRPPGAWAISSGVFLAIVALALGISASVADVTCDGQAYHGTAIKQLIEGWNPLRDPKHSEALAPEAIVNYAKGSWIAGAQVCALAGSCEAGKAIGLMLMAGVFALGFYAVRQLTTLSHLRAAVLAFLAAANPIAVNQCLSYYVDGQIASLFTALLICTILLARQVRQRWAVSLLAVAVITLLVNVKLTGAVFVVTLGGAAAVALWVLGERSGLRRVIATYAAGFMLGLITGFNPYVMNVVHHGTPFYPLGPHGFGGQLEAGFAEHQVPATLQGRNRIDALLRSIFSRCNNGYDAPTRSFTGGPLKVPFAVARGELKTFEDVDTRLCGWGPLTSGILLVAAAGMIFAAPRRREETRMFAAGAAIAICIIATVVVMPYAWWARFVPQLALLPVLAVALLWMRRGNTEHVIAVVLSALLLGNLLLIAVPCFTATVRKSALLRAQLRTLAAAKQPVLVAFHDYQFNRLRFAEAGIRYRAVPELPPGEKQMVLAGEVLISNTTVQIPE